MHPILIIVNVIALGFMIVLLSVVNVRYRIIFFVSGLAPVVLYYLLAYFAYGAITWGVKESLLLLLRGGFVSGVAIGALACYIVSSKKNDD